MHALYRVNPPGLDMTWQEPTINENATMKMQNYYVYTVDFSKTNHMQIQHISTETYNFFNSKNIQTCCGETW